jgi:hypothetical protein
MGNVLVEPSVIAEVLRTEVIKREALDGDEAAQFERRVTKGNRKPNEEPAPVKLNSVESGDQSSTESNSGSAT